jgi:tRNA threonylcarbamoyladenosine biosynthesis protein TsaB
MIGVVETTGDRCSVAILGDPATRSERPAILSRMETGIRNSHDRLLADIFAEALDVASTSPGQLEGVAVAVGPGSFTGIRIGISFAIGLGLACDLPLIPVSTLDAIAWGGRDIAKLTARSRLLALVPDRRGDVYSALYNLHPRFQRLTAPYNVPLSDIPEMVDENVIVAGPGGEMLGEEYNPLSQSILPLDAITVGFYGWELLRRGLCVPPHQVQPLYISGATSVKAPSEKR